MPDVSVIIPTYNRLDFLKTAIASCFDGNDGIDIKVVVVDDGSTDGTCEWLREQGDTRVRPIFQEHKGAQHARNAGLKAARGDTIKFLDSDDYLYPGVLEKQYNALTETEADVCYGPIDIVDGDGKVYRHKSNPPADDLLAGVASGGVTTYPHVFLFRAELARSEQWRPEVPFHQDTVYALDIAAHDPPCTRVQVSIGAHRSHGASRITTKKKRTAPEEKIEKKFAYLVDALKKRQQHSAISDQLQSQVTKGLWEEAHKIAPYDFSRFVSMYTMIQKIEPGFIPPRPNKILHIFDSVFGAPITEGFLNPLRIVKLRT